MSGRRAKLRRAPIIEAVLDVDCDMPPALDLGTLETAAQDVFRDRYPKFRTQFVQEHAIQAPVEGSPKLSVRRGLQAFHFLQADERKDEEKREKVFTYDWRLWTIPELRDALLEAGFRNVNVYWEGTTEDGQGDGEYFMAEKGEECQSWVSYLVALK